MVHVREDIQANRPLAQLSGVVDGERGLTRALSAAGAGRAVVDVGELALVTVDGAGALRRWVMALEQRGVELWWSRVSTALGVQARLVAGLLGARSRVTSVFAPYWCPSCSRAARVLLSPEKLRPLSTLPSIPCATCRGPQVFDDVARDFLRWAQALRTGPIDAELQSLLAHVSSAMPSGPRPAAPGPPSPSPQSSGPTSTTPPPHASRPTAPARGGAKGSRAIPVAPSADGVARPRAGRVEVPPKPTTSS